MIYEFNNIIPTIHPSSFIHEQANVTGNVEIGKNVYVGPGAVLREIGERLLLKMGVMFRRIVLFICFQEQLYILKKELI